MCIATPRVPRGAGIPEGRRVLALLPEEPAGRISTRNAGAVWFRATLCWRPEDGIPAGLVLGEPAAPGARFYSLAQADDAASATRRISCEIRALYPEQLTVGLDGALRSVTEHAALTEAVLEARTVRLADASVTPAAFVEELARQLWEAGLPVSFGSCWTPASGADVSVGTWGLEEALEAFLQAYPAWQMRPSLDKRDASG